MKKSILVALLLLAISANMQAQSLKFGIKAGLNYANLSGTDMTISADYKSEAITSYHAGLIAEIGIFESLSIQPELLYSTQGANYKNAAEDIITKKVGYVSIPLMVKIGLSKSISLELGPQASFLLSGKDDFVAKDPNTFDFSVAGGLGIKVTKSIFISGRYGLGLTEVSKDAKTKNSVVQISAGIMF